jgi:hypothetical protein
MLILIDQNRILYVLQSWKQMDGDCELKNSALVVSQISTFWQKKSSSILTEN